MSELVTSMEESGSAAFGTTPYDYEISLPCDKDYVKMLLAQVLPPLYSLVLVIGLLGNAVVVWVLTGCRRLRVMTDIYLLNLAISDLLFLFTLPFWIYHVAWHDWVFGDAMCKLLSGLYDIALYGEIFFIILLTVDRYLAIVHAVFALRARTVTFGIVSSVVTWGLAVLAALPEFVFRESPDGLVCNPQYPEEGEESWKRFHVLRMNILSLALPLLVMAVCYSGIIKTLLRCPSKKKDKAIRVIFVIMVAYFVFWTPYNVTLLLYTFQTTLVFDDSCVQNRRLDVALLVTEMVSYMHCCINPVIYAFVGEKFQKSLRRFFRRHVVAHLRRSIQSFPSEKLERASSVSPSTVELELSFVF
ncbi:C-C chemokine receptor type 3 [Tupaia chinensis]|uniref:C-C chemokine receptor type 3 n=1 Tax=Tupaia chinensis TaxID=246437 RepID=L8Y514_TUPCH|nr:C-C chemokine receptor type 3 [Tupaia chinensis]XP_027624748.1 C-C chemokine receptor type 3 [Tupaia chinensis]ELV10045.1 C-C chemokine receptor type 3 [Tupaia chinensis]